jgi:lipopolysaccharide/colanic/teichoic acid biosynthesis glycosyltransferase
MRAKAVGIANWQTMVKRLLDVVGSALLLLLFSPVIAVFAVLIKLQDGGPVIHRRRVIGPSGEFDAFKLRSMRVDADEILSRNPAMRREFEVSFKLKNDPRITPIGAVMRKSSIDELPQLLNVLRGEMSLVGPRMISPAELEKYSAEWIFRAVKPGITGYWQVHGRQQVCYAERVEMDTFYVRNWTLGLDARILLSTPRAVLRGAGAH